MRYAKQVRIDPHDEKQHVGSYQDWVKNNGNDMGKTTHHVVKV